MSRERFLTNLEVKFADDDKSVGVFSGYGAVFGNIDSYGDVIERGAFKSTLRAWEDKGKYPPMLLQHGGGFFASNADDMLPIGRWTSMEENSKGLKVEGELFALNTERGQYVYEGLKAGVLDGLSIGFKTIRFRQGKKPSDPSRFLEELDLRELSVVTFPANDKARVGGVKSADMIKTIRDFEQFLRDEGYSNAAAKSIARSGFKASEPRDEDGAELADILARNIETLTKR